MPGLDPGIHQICMKSFSKEMDHRVKPGDDIYPQSNKLDTDSSDAVRPMASAIREAIDKVRILGAF
jgi:hypothetical protein